MLWRGTANSDDVADLRLVELALLVPSSARLLPDGSPAGLWFVEDNLGWDHAESVEVAVPDSAQILEIACVDDWVELCLRFPRDVTAQVAREWGRATRQHARWSIPDRNEVARHHDAVHLRVDAYLTLARRSISVDPDRQIASMIAGWSPDETYWFTPGISYGRDRIGWKLVEHGIGTVWVLDHSAN